MRYLPFEGEEVKVEFAETEFSRERVEKVEVEGLARALVEETAGDDAWDEGGAGGAPVALDEDRAAGEA